MLGDPSLEALPHMLLACSKPEATAADAYRTWLDSLADYPIIGTLTLEWTGHRNDTKSPDLAFINTLLLSLFIPPLLLKHGLDMMHRVATEAGILRPDVVYRYSMQEPGFIAQQEDSEAVSALQLLTMTPAELANLPAGLLERALTNVQRQRNMLYEEQGFLEAIMEADEDWALVEGTDESTGCATADPATPSTSVVGHAQEPHVTQEGPRKRRRPVSRASCNSEQPHSKDPSHEDDQDSSDGRGRDLFRQGGGWHAATPAASSSGGDSGGDDTRMASSDKRMRSRSAGDGDDAATGVRHKQPPDGGEAWSKGLHMDPQTLQFHGYALEHEYVQYRAATMRHNEPYVYITAFIIGLAIAASPEHGRLSPVCTRCLQVGVVLRAFRMTLYSLPLQRMLPRMDALQRVRYLREFADFLIHVGIALVVIPRYIRDVMGTLPLGLHTLLMIIIMPIYLYCMSTQSFVAMRFVWSRWLLGGMLIAFACGSVAMPVMHYWPMPLGARIACVAACWAVQGGVTVMAAQRLRAVEKAARRDFASLVEQQHTGH